MKKNDKYKVCIICGQNSNGKPQCFECWQKSITYIEDEELYASIFSKEAYIHEYEKLIELAKNCKNKKDKQEICINLIGLALFSKNSYIKGIVKNSEKITNETYDEVVKILNKEVENKRNLPKLMPFEEETDQEYQDFRKQFPADIHCQDGHYVRSKEERAIDDYLYSTANLLHAYEPKFRLTNEEKQICKKLGIEFEYFLPDFYIPEYNLYIEYFGKNDEKYNQKMELKIKIFSNRKNINFRYLTYKDENLLLEKIEDILQEFKHK